MTAPAVLIRVRETNRRLAKYWFRSRPKLTVTQWADRYRVLSPEASFRAGPYSSDDAPYQKEPQDAMGDPSIRAVVLMWASQLGKTEILNNFVGYRIDLDPGPMLNLQPTLDMAKSWSKDRLATMLRDTPRLKGRVADVRTRDSDNTMLHKMFAGGHLTIVGANSPAGLAARPIRDLLQDEIDRYPASAGSEGDPSSIAKSRTSTFPNSKDIKVSSPTLKGSPIDKAFDESDQRYYLVPCPHCGHEQKLEFGGKDTTYGLKWDADKPETAHYVCAACTCVIEETDKPLMLKHGRWVAENPTSRTPGFRLSALYSPFFTWARLVERWLGDKKEPLKLRSFVNTILCEPWEETGERVTRHILEDRQSALPEKDGKKLVPMKAAVLTRAVDVQGDRLETAVWAWGDGEECWRVDFKLIPGDPAKPACWKELASLIDKVYTHESGQSMRVSVTFVDTGGHHSEQAYNFARGRVAKKVFAIKGSSLQQGVPIVSEPKRNAAKRVVMYSVGSFTGKEVLMSRLAKIEDAGPGYIHLPDDMDPEHLDQLLNEKLLTTFVKGRPVRAWHQTGPNEQIDLFVYAYAALHSLGPKVTRFLAAIAAKLAATVPPKVDDPAVGPPILQLRPRKKNWATDWK